MSKWTSGHRPQFVRSPRELPRKDLVALIGRRLDAVWFLWNTTDDEWFADAPVVMQFADLTVECCANKIDEYSLTFDTLSVAPGPVAWFGEVHEDLEWRSVVAFGIEHVLGCRLQAINAIEYRFELSDFVGTAPWVLAGIEFGFSEGHLRLVNGLDENAVRREQLDESFRTVRLVPFE